MRSPHLVAVVACLVSIGVEARQERVLIGGPLTPQSTLRMRVTQVMHLTLTPLETPPPGFPPDGLRMEMTNAVVLRQQVGTPDADGRTPVEMLYESVTQTGTVNGQPLPVPPSATEAIEGRTLTLWLGKDNQVAEVSMPAGFPVAAEQTRQMFGAILSAVPRQELAVGETVTRPLTVAMPMPGGVPGQRALSGTTRITLARIDGEGAARVAVLESVLAGGIEGGAAEPTAATALTMSGTGTTQVSLASGLVVAATSKTTLAGPMSLPGAPPDAPRFEMRGLVTMSLERLP